MQWTLLGGWHVPGERRPNSLHPHCSHVWASGASKFWQQESEECIYKCYNVLGRAHGHLYYITWKYGDFENSTACTSLNILIIGRPSLTGWKMTASESSNIWSFTIFDSNSRQVDKWGRCIWIAFRLKFSQLEHATCITNLKHLFSVKLLLSRAG